MRLMDDYLEKYFDRTMESLIEEWQLATKRDISDFKARVQALEKEIPSLAEFETHVSEKLTELENRLRRIKEGF